MLSVPASNGTETILTPFEKCIQELTANSNTGSFTTKDDILAVFKCLSMQKPPSVKITKEEACTSVGADICNDPSFDDFFGADGLAIPEQFDPALKGVTASSAAPLLLHGLMTTWAMFIVWYV